MASFPGREKLASAWAKFGSDSFWVLALRLVKQALAVLVVAVLVRVISKEEFGRYQFVITIVAMCGAFVLPGMQRVIVQSVARGHEGTFLVATRAAFRFSFLGALVLAGLSGYFYWRGELYQSAALGIAALLFPYSQGLNQWQQLELGRRQYRSNSIRVSLGAVASSSAVMLVAILGVTSAPVLVGATFVVLAIQNLIQQHLARRSVAKDAPVEEGAIAYGYRTSVWDAFNVIANYVDRILIFALGSPVALASYAVADRIPEVIKTNLQQLTLVLAPRFAARERYTRELDRKLMLFAAAGAAGVLLFAFLIIPWLLPLLYTGAYAESVIFCQIILFSIAISFFSIVKKSFVDAKLDANSFRTITLWMSVVRILSSAILVYTLGALGAAISTVVYRISGLMLTEYVIRTRYLTDEPG